MAAALGHRQDAALLAQRALNWRKIWDGSVKDGATGLQGFPRPRLDDGSWFSELTGGYDPRSDRGFHEGTAWQYQWLVPQDVAGLAAAMGGQKQALHRLDLFFDYDAVLADPAAVRGGQRMRDTRLASLRRHVERLKILADANDPLVKKRFEDGLGAL